ncbi:hypothetical protein [Streptomyces sp. NPDC047042]|uniref:hypothetical protein n=1 Tax=Streptomyces sp. NPDC047042 TaxID=3154807 RepID=UPI0034013320
MENQLRRHRARTTLSALVGLLAVLASMLVTAGTAQAAPPELPGGKPNWVVSVGGLGDHRDPGNWVRLGYYVFSTNGTVETNYWYWTQAGQPKRVNTVKANCDGPVPHCYVRTVDGFDGDPTGGYRGVFGYESDGKLKVTWETDLVGRSLDEPLVEHWNLEAGLGSTGGVARITSPTYYTNTGTDAVPDAKAPDPNIFSSYDATFGVGYGSKSSLDSSTRVSMNELLTGPQYRNTRYRGTFVRVNGQNLGREWSGGNWTFSGVGGDNRTNPWQKCDGAQCLGFVQHGTSCGKSDESADADVNPDKDRARYIAEIGGGRRNTEEYWCMLLAQGADCYQNNSHPRPMLQIIDDSGTFRGWVGAEAFTHVNGGTPDTDWGQYYWGVFDQVSSDLRPGIPDNWDGSQALPEFSLSYGASVATGDVRWLDRSVIFSGRNFVASGCRYVELIASAANGTTRRGTSSPLCVGTEADGTRAFRGTLDFSDVTGGATSMQITYWVSENGGNTYATKGVVQCTRALDSGDRCVNSSREPVTEFRLSYGNSVAAGAVTWLNRSVTFEGNNHVASGCRYVELVATGADGSSHRATTSKFCASGGDRAFGPQTIDLSAVEGGTTGVRITYWASEDAGVTYATKGVVQCTKDGCENSSREPVTEFRLSYGNSVAAGAVTWLNRSVTFEGNNHVASGCRYVELVATGADGSSHRATTSKFCASGGDRAFGPQTIDLSAVEGGTTSVRITYWASEDGGVTYVSKAVVGCTSDGCVAA